ncbi:uncharacterized protein [Typha angustifolia]|uniref:uncharacterized protein n=1 Tax=Typha angustifolia TaxID=59011 RepID=UPI003C2ED4AF
MGCRVLVGYGRNTRAAYDPWTHEVPWSRQPREIAESLLVDNLMVADIIGNHHWTTERLYREVGSNMAYEISTFPMGVATIEDRWIWWPHPRGIPSVKAIYTSMQPKREHQWEGLPMKAYLQYIHVGNDNRCVMCRLFRETAVHLLFACRYSLEVWQLLSDSEGIESALMDQDWIVRGWDMNKEEDLKIKGLIACTLWSIWRQRNAAAFGEKKMPEQVVVRRAVALAKEHSQTRKEGQLKRKRSSKRWEPP